MRGLFLFPGTFGRRQRALKAQKGVLQFQHELLPLLLFAFADTLKIKRKLTRESTNSLKLTFETCNILFQFAHVALEKQRSLNEFKESLEHGEV